MKVLNESDMLKYNFILIGLLGFLCCPDRSDYNLPLGVFAFLLWGQTQFSQKHRILWLILLSVLADIIWLLVVSISFWGENS
jgi:hypothetical protein